MVAMPHVFVIIVLALTDTIISAKIFSLSPYLVLSCGYFSIPSESLSFLSSVPVLNRIPLTFVPSFHLIDISSLI